MKTKGLSNKQYISQTKVHYNADQKNTELNLTKSSKKQPTIQISLAENDEISTPNAYIKQPTFNSILNSTTNIIQSEIISKLVADINEMKQIEENLKGGKVTWQENSTKISGYTKIISLSDNITGTLLDNLNKTNISFKKKFEKEKNLSSYEELAILREKYESDKNQKLNKSNSTLINNQQKINNKPTLIKNNNKNKTNNNSINVSLNEKFPTEKFENDEYQIKYVKYSDEQKQRIYGEINENSKNRSEKYSELFKTMKESLSGILENLEIDYEFPQLFTNQSLFQPSFIEGFDNINAPESLSYGNQNYKVLEDKYSPSKIENSEIPELDSNIVPSKAPLKPKPPISHAMSKSIEVLNELKGSSVEVPNELKGSSMEPKTIITPTNKNITKAEKINNNKASNTFRNKVRLEKLRSLKTDSKNCTTDMKIDGEISEKVNENSNIKILPPSPVAKISSANCVPNLNPNSNHQYVNTTLVPENIFRKKINGKNTMNESVSNGSFLEKKGSYYNKNLNRKYIKSLSNVNQLTLGSNIENNIYSNPPSTRDFNTINSNNIKENDNLPKKESANLLQKKYVNSFCHTKNQDLIYFKIPTNLDIVNIQESYMLKKKVNYITDSNKFFLNRAKSNILASEISSQNKSTTISPKIKVNKSPFKSQQLNTNPIQTARFSESDSKLELKIQSNVVDFNVTQLCEGSNLNQIIQLKTNSPPKELDNTIEIDSNPNDDVCVTSPPKNEEYHINDLCTIKKKNKSVKTKEKIRKNVLKMELNDGQLVVNTSPGIDSIGEQKNKYYTTCGNNCLIY